MNRRRPKDKKPVKKEPTILLFDQREERSAVVKAMDYAEAGGTALHVWTPSNSDLQRAPTVFRINRKLWAHLIDMDKERLLSLASKFGVRVLKLEREGARGQHIDLCGTPLQRAIFIARRPRDKEAPEGAVV